MTEMSTTNYRDLLQHALPDTPDADTVEIDINTLFTPRRHRSALEPDVTVVRGGRGVGKTVWFKTLLQKKLRDLAADEYQLPRLLEVDPLEGFGSERKLESYPSRAVLEDLLAKDIRPVNIWRAVALKALNAPELAPLDDWGSRVRWIEQHPERAERALNRIDREAGADATTRLFVFDALDRLHENRGSADRLTGSILQFALDLRIETRNLRAKVFIRDDMLESSRAHFPDSSKLVSNAVDLTWAQVDLYGLLFQHLGNANHELSDQFRKSTGKWQEKTDRYVPPPELTADADVQRDLLNRIAGPFMGPNHRRGRTYNWLPNHLADGRGQTSPRSFLVALRTATDETVGTYNGHPHPLHWEAIKQGVQKASRTRIAEMEEDLPWVATAVEPLEGLQVPIDQDEVLRRWRESELDARLRNLTENASEHEDVRTGPQHPDDFPKLVDEMISLGVMTRRANGKIDLPDVYRIGFKLGRKGGVPRVRA